MFVCSGTYEFLVELYQLLLTGDVKLEIREGKGVSFECEDNQRELVGIGVDAVQVELADFGALEPHI